MKVVKVAAILVLPCMLFLAFLFQVHSTAPVNATMNQTLTFKVDALHGGRQMSPTLFGVFFEEINHAGAGGLWAELVSNRGFEAGGQNTPSDISPWYTIGTNEEVSLETDRSSSFDRNRIALRMDIFCDKDSSNPCPEHGVGVANPGFWGMDIRSGESYHVSLWLRSMTSTKLSVAFTSGNGQEILAQDYIIINDSASQDWHRQELYLEATGTDHSAVLALTSSMKGVIWLDQISAMPVNTFKGHGFRKELAHMLADLNPSFIRFPGGCYVEGSRLENAWRWRETVGPWQERPGHFGDIWNYWSDDGLGYFEYLQLAEDIGALPVWVFNNGISHNTWVTTSMIQPFVKDTLDGIEFARGPTSSKWGSLRARMGHPEPFPLYYIAVGNEDCWKPYYRGNYLAFYNSIKASYPDIKLISNCDATTSPLDHPADLYDFHIYTNAWNLFSMTHQFDHTTREGPKAEHDRKLPKKVFVSEYAVVGSDSGKGSLLAAIAEGAFLIGLELNSDVVEMASYAPLFVHENDRRWNPDAIVFNAWQQYGTPSYWVQHLFKHSSGASLLPSSLTGDRESMTAVVASALRRCNNRDDDFLTVKVVNFGRDVVAFGIEVDGLTTDGFDFTNSTMSILSSTNLMDENSFADPEKVVPKTSRLAYPGSKMQIVLPPYSVVALDLQIVGEYGLHSSM